MYREILANKWILGGLCFLVVFTGVCYLYYQHETAPLKQQATEPNEIIQQSTRNTTAETANRTEQAADAPADSNTQTAEKTTTETTGAETSTDKTTKPVTASTQQTDNIEEVRVSPHGLGPYPKTPDGYPHSKPFNDEMSLEHELLERVRIKLFNEYGVFADGIGMDNNIGLVQVVTKDQIYIGWGYTTDVDGRQVEIC